MSLNVQGSDGIIININDSINISSDVASQSEVDVLKKKIDLLKRVTDVEYAKECVRKEILAEYQSLILTDKWFEASASYIRKRVDEISDGIKNEWEIKMGGYLTFTNGIIYKNLCDIVFISNGREIKVSELLNPNPEIEGLEFEKYVINYCKTHV